MDRKAAGIVRTVDALGRIVLPAEIREKLGVRENDGLELLWDGDRLLLQKHEPACTFCGATDDVVPFASKAICRACREKISKLR